LVLVPQGFSLGSHTPQQGMGFSPLGMHSSIPPKPCHFDRSAAQWRNPRIGSLTQLHNPGTLPFGAFCQRVGYREATALLNPPQIRHPERNSSRTLRTVQSKDLPRRPSRHTAHPFSTNTLASAFVLAIVVASRYPKALALGLIGWPRIRLQPLGYALFRTSTNPGAGCPVPLLSTNPPKTLTHPKTCAIFTHISHPHIDSPHTIGIH
jgi:hypothetical protein